MTTVKPSSKRLFSLLLSLALLIGTIVVYSALLRPAYLEINQLRGDLAAKSDLVSDQRRVVEKVKELLDQYPSLTGPQQTISRAIPNQEGFPTLINQMSGLTKTAGLSLHSLSFSLQSGGKLGAAALGGPSVPVLGVIQLNLDLSGNYASFKNFLGLLETNLRIMDLASFSLNPEQGDKYNYNMVVNTYYQTLQ